MKKLHLDLDALEVETFSTLHEESERGTVDGREWTEAWNSNCCPQSASDACLCLSERGTCDTGCNYNYPTCDGNWSCGACQTGSCPEFC